MFISKLSIDGYRNCCEKSQISFNKGLNILVGENASGKSTIIDALRLILKDQEQSYITEDDFYKSFTQDVKNNNIRIDVTLENLNQEEKITFLSWCNANFDAELHLEVESNPSPRGYFKKSIWGGTFDSGTDFKPWTWLLYRTDYQCIIYNCGEFYYWKKKEG